jgi:peptide deformylase
VALRVVIFGGGLSSRYAEADAVPYTVLVNPRLRPLRGGRAEDWEGCLSVPGMRGLVPRHRRLRYRGFDQWGQPIDRSVADFHARVVQHEVDHLDGVLLVERLDADQRKEAMRILRTRVLGLPDADPDGLRALAPDEHPPRHTGL